MELETKSLSLELKADSEGAFSATFTTLNVLDHHGDVTLPGAFPVGKEVLVGAYQHEMGQLPVGKGLIQADDQRVWLEGAFFLNTTLGKDTYLTVKNASNLIEWSYIYQAKESYRGEFDTGKGLVDARFLKAIDPWSVDPVLRGAGIGTGITSIKSNTPFADEAEQALAAVQSILKRAGSLADLRMKEGRMMSAANMERLRKIMEAMRSAVSDMEKMMADATPPPKADLDHAYAQFQRSVAQLSGVSL